MKSLATAFKEVYGEALKEYGFKKVKGRQPYYARVIGDEIVHVITCAPRPSLIDGYKGFVILGGVATVYRACINLDVAPSQNFGWLNCNLDLFQKMNSRMSKNEYQEKFEKWYVFEYERDNENSLMQIMKYSLEITNEIMIPILNNIKHLVECISYFEMINESMLTIYIDETYGKYSNGWEYNEGLLNVYLFDLDTYANRNNICINKDIEYIRDMMDTGQIRYTSAELEKIIIRMNEMGEKLVGNFKILKENEMENKRVSYELEKRKQINIEYLKLYGLI